MKLTNPVRHPPGVPRVEKPRTEGQFHLADGRRLGYAEFGDPSGPVVLWFHSTLGARRQFPMLGRRAAEKLGLRVIIVERPGVPARTALSHNGFGDTCQVQYSMRAAGSVVASSASNHDRISVMVSFG